MEEQLAKELESMAGTVGKPKFQPDVVEAIAGLEQLMREANTTGKIASMTEQQKPDIETMSNASTEAGPSMPPSPHQEQEEDKTEECEKVAKELASMFKDSKGKIEHFKLHGTGLGNRWAKELKENSKTKEAYANHKGYAAQRNFRLAWASKLWGKVERQRKHIVEQYEEKESLSKFMPVSIWVGKEGGDMEAVLGICHFVKKQTLAGKAKKYIRISPNTNRIELAMPRDSFKEGEKESWAIEEKAKPDEEANPTRTAAQSKAAAAPPIRKRSSNELPGTGSSAKTDPKETTKKPKVEQNPAYVTAWKKAAEHKTSIDKNMQVSTEVKSAIDTDPSWAWAKKMDEFDVLQDSISGMMTLQAQRPFWRELAFAKTANDLKKKHLDIGPELLHHGAAALQHSGSAARAAEVIKAMHAAKAIAATTKTSS